MDISDTTNKFLVGTNGKGNIVITFPPIHPITPDEALNLAVYLSILADPNGEKFIALRIAIENT